MQTEGIVGLVQNKEWTKEDHRRKVEERETCLMDKGFFKSFFKSSLFYSKIV